MLKKNSSALMLKLLVAAVLWAECGLTGTYAAPMLKDVFKNDFLVGVALNEAQFSGQDSCAATLVPAQFNCISPENVLKWERIHPQLKQYEFGAADHYVEYGQQHHMVIIGHTLVWHNQTPKWVFVNPNGQPISRDALLQRLHDHISTVVGRYRGKIHGWDVVNEALNEDGTMRATPWLKIIGTDYLRRAYEFAHEADPKAELYYNDYGLENPAKRAGALVLIRNLQRQGVPIAAVGLQGHYKLGRPSLAEIDETINAFARLGVKVNITELDIDVLPAATQSDAAEVSMNFALKTKLNPYTNGLPDSVQQELTKRYAGVFAVFVKNQKVIDRVTFWGVADGNSWLNDWPVNGRTSYPLLFDRDCRPKPAFEAIIKTATQK